jgi:hypothetical protein
MLSVLLGLSSFTLLVAVAQQRAEIARLRRWRRMDRESHGSWAAFHAHPADLAAARWWSGR